MRYMLIEVSDREIGTPEFFDSDTKAFDSMVDRIIELDDSLNKEIIVEDVVNKGYYSEDDVHVDNQVAWVSRHGVHCDWQIFEVDSGLSQCSVDELSTELRNRGDVVAVQIWQKEDVVCAFKETCGYDPSDNIVNEIANQAQGALEDCQYGWESLYAVVDDVVCASKDCQGKT